MKIVLAIFVILTVDKFNCQESECFSQSEFESAYNESLINYLNLEGSLLESVRSGQLGIDTKNPIFNHFKSSKIRHEARNQDQFASVCNMALKVLRKNKNYSRQKFQNCSAKIMTSKFCTPIKVSCNSSDTK